MRGISALGIALAAGAALPAAAAAGGSTSYSIEKASGFERVTFQGDPATCASFGTCGDSGTVAYTFGREPGRGSLVLERRANGGIRGRAAFRSHGRTVADVSSLTGNDCKQTVRRTRERFSLNSRSRLGKLLFTFHQRPGRDLLATDCLTPTEAHLARSNALPRARFKARSFDRDRTNFQIEGHSPFTDRGYSGEVRWKLTYAVHRR